METGAQKAIDVGWCMTLRKRRSQSLGRGSDPALAETAAW